MARITVMRKLSLEEIKNEEFEILKLFKEFCEKNELYYTLAGGTLLGAIRHKGFIPWDDDIDVLMPRKDFEKLLDLSKLNTSMLPKNIKITHWRDINGIPFPFIKMINLKTKVIDRYSHADKNLWIDIFPMDGCTINDVELEGFYKKVIFFRRLLLLRNAKIGEGKTLIRKYVKSLIIPVLKLIPQKAFCEKYNKLVQKYQFEKCDYVAGIAWGYGPQERIKKDDYLTKDTACFEGEMFNIPKNYDEYLKGLYGDYMKLPPESERNTRHDIEVFIND